jgi:hypothetical protein
MSGGGIPVRSALRAGAVRPVVRVVGRREKARRSTVCAKEETLCKGGVESGANTTVIRADGGRTDVDGGTAEMRGQDPSGRGLRASSEA